jgi:hypothetical protein
MIGTEYQKKKKTTNFPPATDEFLSLDVFVIGVDTNVS